MAHFAQLDDNNIVINVIVVDNDDCKRKEFWDPLGIFTGKEESEEVGIAFCKSLCGHDTHWKQTSYSRNFRGNFAGIGHTYMTGVRTLGVASTDIFIEQQPYPSWSIGINTAKWYSPSGVNPDVGLTTTQLNAGMTFIWDEVNFNNGGTGWASTVGGGYNSNGQSIILKPESLTSA